MHSKNRNIEIMTDDETDKVIWELFKSLQNRYQNSLEKTMKGSEYVRLLYYKCHKIKPKRGRSYIDFPDG